MTPRRAQLTPHAALDDDDPGEARERTALAWARSALNMAASGTLVARAAFEDHLAAVGVICVIAMAALSGLTWHHGQRIYRHRRGPGRPAELQGRAFAMLTVATTLIAACAIALTLAS